MKTIKRFLGVFLFALALVLVVPSILPVNDNVYTVEAATKISKKKVTLIKGQTTTLNITGTKKKVKWSSNKKSVATVSSKGKVTAKKKGTAKITAKVGNKKYTCEIVVQTPKISNSKLTLSVGETSELEIIGTDQKVTWKSANKKIASIDKNGKVTGKKVGKVKITATVLKKKYNCTVTVKKSAKVSSLTLNSQSLRIKEGEIYKIGYEINPTNAANKSIVWSSSNNDVVIVNAYGEITGVSPGTAIITAKCDGKSDSCSVAVETYFNTNEAISKIQVSNYKIDTGVISIVKNNYKYPISIELDCIFYQNSVMIGKRSDSEYAFEPGRECALFFLNPWDSNYNEVSFDSYDVRVKVEDTSNLVKNVDKITYSSNFGIDNVMVNVKNNGTDVEYTKIAIVFYKNGCPVGYDYQYAEVNKAGSVDVLEFNFPYDSNYESIIPDNYKIYVNSSYKYTWQ